MARTVCDAGRFLSAGFQIRRQISRLRIGVEYKYCSCCQGVMVDGCGIKVIILKCRS
jgi:Zn-finger nucleic acid-binding protein